MFEILAFGIALAALIFSRKALNKLREAEARIAALEEGVAPQRTIVAAAPSPTEAPLAPTIAPDAAPVEPSPQTWIRDAGRSGSTATAGNAGRGGHRRPRDAPAAHRRALKSVSARAGWSGSAGSRSRSAGFSSCATRSKPDCSAPPRACSSADCSRWPCSPPANGPAARKRFRRSHSCRSPTSRRSLPPPAPRSRSAPSTRATRSTTSSRPPSPSSRSALSRSRRSRPRCCTGRRSQDLASSARS